MNVNDLFSAPGLCYVGDVSDPHVNHGQSLPMFEPVAPEGRPDINTLEGWNAMADKYNRKAFLDVFGREPSCTSELRAWESSYFASDFKWEGIPA